MSALWQVATTLELCENYADYCQIKLGSKLGCDLPIPCDPTYRALARSRSTLRP